MGHRATDGDHQWARQWAARVAGAGRGAIGQAAQGRLHRTLRTTGAVGGHHARRGFRKSELDQGAGRLGQVRDRRGEDERAGCCGQCGPVHLAAHIGDGVGRPQWQPGVGRHGDGGRQARHDVERQLGLGNSVHLGNDRIHRQRVTGDQADHVDAGLGLSHQDLGHFGRLTECGPDVRADDNKPCGGVIGALGRRGRRLGRAHRRRKCGSDNIQHGLWHIGIGEHTHGIAQHGARARRQQTGVTRSRTDKRDTSRLGLAPAAAPVTRHLHSRSTLITPVRST